MRVNPFKKHKIEYQKVILFLEYHILWKSEKCPNIVEKYRVRTLCISTANIISIIIVQSGNV